MRIVRPASTSSWLIVALTCLLILVIGFSYSRSLNRTNNQTAEKELTTGFLTRTHQLARRKQESLETYNKVIPRHELLEFYREHTGRELKDDAYAELERLMLAQVVDQLWLDSSNKTPDESPILHRTMFESISKLYPHRTLTNADVILFPDDSNLRIIIAEPAADYFRDTARHWRWIGDYVDQLARDRGSELKELDTYAAEELSEFLSVLAIGVIELAVEQSEDFWIESSEIAEVFDRISKYSPDLVSPRDPKLGFSEQDKRNLMQSFPDPLFHEITEKVGINYEHKPNKIHHGKRTDLAVPLGIAGGGVSVGDMDGDGLHDIYFAGDEGGALFRNTGSISFTNVSRVSGLPSSGETRAGYFVDFDNDGDQDLFITFVGQPNRLLENDGSGSFRDVTKEVGLLNDHFISHEAVWFDMDNDGLLELYVANFGDWLAGESPTLGRINSNAPPNRFYKHELRDGHHRFIEAGDQLNVDDRGWTHCVGAYDFDQDGWADLFSVNDFGASLVYRNLQGKGFKEVSREIHMDDIYNGMSFTLLDLNHDSNFSIYVTQIMKLIHRQRYSRPTEETPIQFDPTKKDNLRVLTTNRLFTKAFKSSFRDDHNYLVEPTSLGWSWDASGLDYENDGDLDLLVLNGTEAAIPSRGGRQPRNYRRDRNFLAKFNFEQNAFFLQENGYFYNMSENNPVAFFGNSRGSAFFDFDDDGDLDVVVSNYDGPPQFFENRQRLENNWIRIKLEGSQSNRDAIGAVVEIRFDGKSRFAPVVSGSGFLSQDPRELHFGLGDATEIEQVIVRWPSGAIQETGKLKINESHVIREQ